MGIFCNWEPLFGALLSWGCRCFQSPSLYSCRGHTNEMIWNDVFISHWKHENFTWKMQTLLRIFRSKNLLLTHLDPRPRNATILCCEADIFRQNDKNTIHNSELEQLWTSLFSVKESEQLTAVTAASVGALDWVKGVKSAVSTCFNESKTFWKTFWKAPCFFQDVDVCRCPKLRWQLLDATQLHPLRSATEQPTEKSLTTADQILHEQNADFAFKNLGKLHSEHDSDHSKNQQII